MNSNGYHGTSLIENKHYWLTKNEITQFFEKNVNQNQISKIELRERELIAKELDFIFKTFNYKSKSPYY